MTIINKKWQEGQGVSWRTNDHINRGYQIETIDYLNGEVLVKSVDTGYLIEWHVIKMDELIRDKKYDMVS